MTFHTIVRRWCRIYKPMLDNPKNGNRRFYLTDTTAGVVELAKGISNKFSPCVVMESSVEGGGPIERPNRNYPIYFFVRARDMSDGDAAAEAKEEAWYHARQFLAWLKDKHDKQLSENDIDGDFARIQIDNGIDINTIGPVENGWFAVLVQFDREEPLDLCVDEELYEEVAESDDPEDEETTDSETQP